MSVDPKEIWLELCRHYTSDLALVESLYAELHKKYTGKGRHYHSLHHIAALLQLSRQYDAYLQDKDLVNFSIFYHDIIYNVLRKDNEPRSAVRAVKRLVALNVPTGRREAVSLFIRATQTHAIPDIIRDKAHITSDLSFFLDFDMAILAAPWDQYELYTRQVRKEYRVYPDILYKPGRKAFLEKALQTGQVFLTSLFREQYEAQARANMERELQSLS